MEADQSDAVLSILQNGQLTLQGEFLWGSNYTFLVSLDHHGDCLQAVYKPTRGERPLWDFTASSLARREVAAFLVSQALRWDLVPPTILRRRGPLGQGSLQLYIEHDPEYHYFSFTPEDRERLRPVALFDLLINNADRKGSHVLVDRNRRIWLIDHGVCFHAEEKLRTVIWDFSGEPIPDSLLSDLEAFRNKLESSPGSPSALAASLEGYLTRREVLSLAARAERLLASRRFPNPPPNRRPYPWPLL